ncbi:hypothetical protein H6P81_003484 [Aristolochia fimbriata]|uniref:Uncharacterized protein n=1 Tax=Aristolochia fimbriata TaxID=158543 RepID=A0AAV7FDS2_ARIFI|nr:hypothetical protein H6P81_003484 [Aristolochia fimbriata]
MTAREKATEKHILMLKKQLFALTKRSHDSSSRVCDPSPSALSVRAEAVKSGWIDLRRSCQWLCTIRDTTLRCLFVVHNTSF